MASSRDRPLLVLGIAIAVLAVGATPASALMRASVELYEGSERLVITSEEGTDGVKSETLTLFDSAVGVTTTQVSVNGGADQVFPIGPECIANGLTQADCVIPTDMAIVVDLRSGNDSATSTTAQRVEWIAGQGNDTITGGPGTDVFFAASVADGADTFSGGDGLDIAQYQERTANLVIRLDGVANDGSLGENDNIKQDVESIVSGSGFDTIVGSFSPQIITGGPGNDTIDGGAGPDVMFGGPGFDTVTYAGRARPVDADPTGVGDDGSITDGATVGARDTISDDVERLIGTNGGDTLTAGGALEELFGGPGADTLTSGPNGGDLKGEAGNDTLVGGPAVDLLDGGADDDLIQGGGNTDFLDGGPGDDDLEGGEGDDNLAGGPDDDTLDGGVGADRLFGEAGNDTLSARDLAADAVIDCGADTDSAIVDVVEPATVDSEAVDRTAAPADPDPGGGGTATGGGTSGGGGTPTSTPPPPGTGSGVTPVLTPPVIARAPAKIRVLRAGIRDGRLDLRLEITSAATGSVELEYHSAGRRTRFTVPIPGGSGNKPTAWSLTRRLPSFQRRTTTGILTLTYEGDARVRPDDVRLRAANGRALMTRGTVKLGTDRKLEVGGTISRRAIGVVRIRLGYVGPDGKVAFLRYRARIRAGKGEDRARWSIAEKVPAAAAAGGQLSIQFTGYLPRRIRGEQTSKAVTPTR